MGFTRRVLSDSGINEYTHMYIWDEYARTGLFHELQLPRAQIEIADAFPRGAHTSIVCVIAARTVVSRRVVIAVSMSARERVAKERLHFLERHDDVEADPSGRVALSSVYL